MIFAVRPTKFQIENVRQAWLRGFRVKGIAITFVNRKRGKSKLTKTEIEGTLSYIIRTWLRIGGFVSEVPERG